MSNLTENRRQGVGNITIDTEVTENGIYPVEGKGIYAAIAAAAGMTNPMTASGDIIVGGTSGAATRLAKGTAGQVLTMNAGATAPEWQAPSAGGTQLYQHAITISGTTVYVITTRSAPATDKDSFYSLVVSKGVVFVGVADGTYSNGARFPLIALKTGTTHTYYYLYTEFSTSSASIGAIQVTGSTTISDTVDTL